MAGIGPLSPRAPIDTDVTPLDASQSQAQQAAPASSPDGCAAAPTISRSPTSSRPAPAAAAQIGAVAGRNAENEAVAARFYDAFVGKDFAAMERAYAPGATFKDPVFQYDDRAGTMNMWRRLLGGSDDMKATYEVLGSEGDKVRVLWKADYTFIGRPVHNEIEATLTIRDGKIVDHQDSFPWDKWARQALPLGPFASAAPVRLAVNALLRHFIDR